MNLLIRGQIVQYMKPVYKEEIIMRDLLICKNKRSSIFSLELNTILIMKDLLLKKKVLIPVGIGLVVVVSMLFSGGDDGVEYDFAEADYVDVTQEVSVTGTVEADPKVEMRFQTSGQVQDVYAEVGDFVASGQALAVLDKDKLYIKVLAAEADLAMAQANYDQVVAGSTDEAIAVAQASVDKAAADLAMAEQSLASTVILADDSVASAQLTYDAALTDYENAITTYGEDLVHAYEDIYNTIGDVFNEVDDSMRDADNILGVADEDVNDTYELAYETGDRSLYNSTQLDYSDLEADYTALYAEYSDIDTDDYALMDAMISDIEQFLDDAGELMNNVDEVLAESPTIGSFTDTVKDTKRTMIAAEISDINSITATFENAQQAVDSAQTDESAYLQVYEDDLASAKQALETAQAQSDADVVSAEVSVQVYEALLAQAEASYADISADPREVDLASLKASVASAQAAVSLAYSNLDEAYIYAPSDGVITEIYGDPGENISSNEDFMVMVSDNYKITANVSETDISKVKVGDKILMTLDAFAYDKEFEAEITDIDPAETVVQGVIYYQVTAMFTAEDEDIKPGMTANMDIITAELDSVLGVPVRAVKYDGSRVYVLMVRFGEAYEVDVEIGVRGDQYIEILEGLDKGDKVVVYIR